MITAQENLWSKSTKKFAMKDGITWEVFDVEDFTVIEEDRNDKQKKSNS